MSLSLIDIARYKSLIEQSCLCTIRYFDRPDSFCDLVTWPTTIADDTFPFLFYICNISNEDLTLSKFCERIESDNKNLCITHRK
jgi:hypothetical protein